MAEQVIMSGNSDSAPETIARGLRRSISRVPDDIREHIRELNSKASEPQLVSLGPYHRGKLHLRSMEANKVRAVIHILKKSGKPSKEYALALEEVVQGLMEPYEVDAEWKDEDRFIRLMIYDGCFLLETLRQYDDPKYGDYDSNSIFGNLKDRSDLKARQFVADILRIDNQVPMLVLQKLISVEGKKTAEQSAREIHRLVYRLLQRVGPIEMDRRRANGVDSTNCLHILDLYWRMMVGDEPLSGDRSASSKKAVTGDRLYYSASQLRSARVKFTKTDSIKNRKFDDGRLLLPSIKIDIFEYTEVILLNLMTFEQLHMDARHLVCSYVHCMSTLIKSKRDVFYIRKGDIIKSEVQHDEVIVKFFNNIRDNSKFLNKIEHEDNFRPLNDYYTRGIIRNYMELLGYITLSIVSVAAIFLLGFMATKIIFRVLLWQRTFLGNKHENCPSPTSFAMGLLKTMEVLSFCESKNSAFAPFRPR